MPEEFIRALLSLRQASHLPHILLEEVPPPRRLAPFTAALAMRTIDEDAAGQPLSTGRMVVLHDPVGQLGWNGTFRVVSQMRTQVDSIMAVDPMLSEGVWGWMLDCLDGSGAGFHDITGTVTREMSEAFGGWSCEAPLCLSRSALRGRPTVSTLGSIYSGGRTLCVRRLASSLPVTSKEFECW